MEEVIRISCELLCKCSKDSIVLLHLCVCIDVNYKILFTVGLNVTKQTGIRSVSGGDHYMKDYCMNTRSRSDMEGV